jgi:predicted nucleic acid-binding protein
MIVVDANVIAYRFIEGEKTNLACRVQEKDGTWIVPLLWRHEFLNVLATVTRAGIIDIADAFAIWRNAVNILSKNERPIHYDQALRCAVELQISAYDAQYIVLGQTQNCLVVTEDNRLCKTFPDTAISMRSFLELKY